MHMVGIREFMKKQICILVMLSMTAWPAEMA